MSGLSALNGALPLPQLAGATAALPQIAGQVATQAAAVLADHTGAGAQQVLAGLAQFDAMCRNGTPTAVVGTVSSATPALVHFINDMITHSPNVLCRVMPEGRLVDFFVANGFSTLVRAVKLAALLGLSAAALNKLRPHFAHVARGLYAGIASDSVPGTAAVQDHGARKKMADGWETV